MTNNRVLLISLVALSAIVSSFYFLKQSPAESSTLLKAPHELRELKTEFDSWKKEYNKSFGLTEDKRRFAIFLKNYKDIEEINRANRSYTAGVNQLTGLTQEEIAALYTGLRKLNQSEPKRYRTLNITAPVSVDWRRKGAVTPVKDQKECASCYAFSSTGALEGLIQIKTGKLVPLSEQQLVDCSTGWGNYGCGGGYMTNCFQYTQVNGIMRGDSYPYTATKGQCRHDSSQVIHKGRGYTEVLENRPEELLKAVAMQPVSVAVECLNVPFINYKSGIIDDTNCGTFLQHAVLVVGYDTDPKLKKDYWIVKNSWGTKWGDQGYVKIARGKQNQGKGICGINQLNSYPEY